MRISDWSSDVFSSDLRHRSASAVDRFGSGTTGSRVLNGTYRGHKECEEALKEFYAMDHAMVFSTGYQANLGKIGRASCRERVCQYVYISVVAVTLKKNNNSHQEKYR